MALTRTTDPYKHGLLFIYLYIYFLMDVTGYQMEGCRVLIFQH